MQGSKRNAKKDWYRGRGLYSFRGEMKYSIKKNKKYLNKKARNCSNLSNGCMYKKLAKEKAYEYIS